MFYVYKFVFTISMLLAVMTTYNLLSNTSKTVRLLKRGDSFGENSLMNHLLRESTTISKQPIEFLTLKDEVCAVIEITQLIATWSINRDC